MTVNEFMELAKDSISSLYGKEESALIAIILLEDTLGIEPGKASRIKKNQLTTSELDILNERLVKLKSGIPVQYVTSTAWFYGMKLEVNNSVLIPRPETEELADIIIKDQRSVNRSLNILDIGCGSGCLLVAVGANLKNHSLFGLDISENAVSLARKNLKNQGLNAAFEVTDILKDEVSLNEMFDIIMSNPPYIPFKESHLIDKQVLENEPHLALFVPDDDPVIFYRKIVDFAYNNLSESGTLYFESNPAYTDLICEMAADRGFKYCEVSKDMSGKYRFLKIRS